MTTIKKTKSFGEHLRHLIEDTGFTPNLPQNGLVLILRSLLRLNAVKYNQPKKY